MKLVIASRNVHKIREIRAILKPIFPDWDIYSLIDFPDYRAPKEESESFEENAMAKAVHAAKTLNSLALADDSGLVVPALEGKPGVHSARYAGEDATDKDNRKKLLQEMNNLQDQQRAAYYHCTLALASPEGIIKTVTAYCEGIITEQERGSQGFGYDPLFMKYEYSKTFAQLEEEVKNRVSHRRKALDKMIITLETLKTQEAENHQQR